LLSQLYPDPTLLNGMMLANLQHVFMNGAGAVQNIMATPIDEGYFDKVCDRNR